LQLRPGMTATAEITTAQRKDALLVPNAALRFVPPVAKAQANRSLLSSLMPRPPSAGPKVASEASAKDGTQTLWLLRDGQPKAVKVSVKGTNGQLSEVRTTDGDAPLHAGDEVIIEATVSGK